METTTYSFYDVARAVIAAGFEPSKVIRHDYSGRFMFGDTCFALVVENSSQAAQIVFRLHTLFKDSFFGEDELMDVLMGWQQDSMGRDVVVYWPTVKLTNVPDSWGATV